MRPIMMKPAFRALLMPGFTVLAACGGGSGGAPIIESAWFQVPPPGAQVTALYFTLDNRSSGTVTLVGAASPACERIELHETRIEDGMARMRRVERIEVAAGSKRVLEPGATHAMCFGPAPSPLMETIVPVSLALRMADGAMISLDHGFLVRAR